MPMSEISWYTDLIFSIHRPEKKKQLKKWLKIETDSS